MSLVSAERAHSPALLAFGSDSFVELLSAAVVMLQFVPIVSISERRATTGAAILLFGLAAIVTVIAALSLATDLRPETSIAGMVITTVALMVMPTLAMLKRREARLLNNRALALDAIQSATCAYLAAVTLVGLGVNALFHIAWFDSLAALIAVPLLLKEAREAWRGKRCCC